VAEQQAKRADATARGGLGAAQARVSGSAAAAGNEGAQVDSAKAQLARAEADAKKAQQDLARMIESMAGGTGARVAPLPSDNASGNFVKVVQRVPVRIALEDLPAGVTLRAGVSADVVVKTRSK
jgi:multidrug resistance efflux pump